MVRILSTILFVTLIGFASDCQAQRQGGLFQRHFRSQQLVHSQQVVQAPHASFQSQSSFSQSPFTPKPIEFSRYSTYRNPLVSRILDGKTTKYRDPAEVDSRYVGGFHQSHFENIGIPSGDIGIRGNAYQWRTW
jgi:hypothetical protein